VSPTVTRRHQRGTNRPGPRDLVPPEQDVRLYAAHLAVEQDRNSRRIQLTPGVN